ncbi:recombination mediator RecR [Candidatus Ichthyocystis sparus]|uniref:recombination mediator RecR n=1 Tax=Candidatus Ichthyocystis sparus TaxID=1561004 RepID=UPI000B861A13|nr:recombination mediator RecR [Candidatus Ichthyocystis sparus]
MSCIDELVDAFRCLPGVSSRMARRFAFHLLHRDRVAAKRMSDAISQALDKVVFCSLCNAFAESVVCAICCSSSRDCTKLCVVSSAADMYSIEQTRVYGGLYFILSGQVSPLDDLSPQQSCFDKLVGRLCEGRIKELILATGFTPEGEATAFLVSKVAMERGVSVSRISRGLPAGSEIEYSDQISVGQSIMDRVIVYSPPDCSVS